ncbi:hypothetical protein Gotur_028207, partial [Gossypium turneri]
SLAEGYVSELWDFTRVSVAQNNLQELKEIQVDRIYSKAVNVPTFLKKLMNITGMSEQWVTARIKQKGDSRCIPWKNLKDLILAHPDARNKVDIFALSIYGLVVFPKTLGHIDEAVTDLFDRLDKRVSPVPVILTETFRSLNTYRRAGEGRFIRSAQLLLAWFHSHFWKVDKVSYREKDIEWRAPWLLPDEILYRSRQFVPATHGLAECEFSYKDDGYKKKACEMDFEKKNTELEKKIEQMEEEKVNLRLDVDVQKLEADKLRKGKKKAEEELDSLKTDYKKLRLSMRTAGLRKTSEQWHKEVREERNKSDRWERKFQKMQARNEALGRSLSESQKEKGELKDRVVELEGSLCQHRSR